MLLLILAAMVMLPCAAQRPGLVKDEDGYTNIRKGPGTNYAIVDKVPRANGTRFTPPIPMAPNRNSWATSTPARWWCPNARDHARWSPMWWTRMATPTSAKVQAHAMPLWAKCATTATSFAVATLKTAGIKSIPRQAPSVAI